MRNGAAKPLAHIRLRGAIIHGTNACRGLAALAYVVGLERWDRLEYRCSNCDAAERLSRTVVVVLVHHMIKRLSRTHDQAAEPLW